MADNRPNTRIVRRNSQAHRWCRCSPACRPSATGSAAPSASAPRWTPRWLAPRGRRGVRQQPATGSAPAVVDGRRAGRAIDLCSQGDPISPRGAQPLGAQQLRRWPCTRAGGVVHRGLAPTAGACPDRFEISARGSDSRRRDPRRRRDIHRDGLHRRAEPIILSGAADVTGHKLGFTQVSAVTALVAGVMTILFGVVARLPFAFAAGLGINSFLASSVVGSGELAGGDGPGGHRRSDHRRVAVSGLRRLIFDAVPMPLKTGDHRRHRVVHPVHRSGRRRFRRSTGCPRRHWAWAPRATGSITTVPTLVFVHALVTGVLVARKVRGGILIGLISGTVVAPSRSKPSGISGSAADKAGGWGLSVPPVGFAVRPARSVAGRRRQPGQLRAHRHPGRHHAGLHPGVHQLLRRHGHLHPACRARPAGRRARQLPAAAVGSGGRAPARWSAARCRRRRTVFIRIGHRHRRGRPHRTGEPATGGLFLAAMFLTRYAIVPSDSPPVVVGALDGIGVARHRLSTISAPPVVLTTR